jgi:arabinose operon protein AraL
MADAPLQASPLVVDAFIFDLDGTVYLGDAALPCAVTTIAQLRQRGKQVLFVSNKPLQPRQVYAQKLTGLGIPTSPDDVITSAYVLGYYLAHTYPALNYYVIGEAPLKNELREFGLIIQNELLDQDPMEVIDPKGIDAVIVAFDRTLDYRKLNTAYQALLHGARFFATNADNACPMPGGGIPDAGATIAALEHITHRKLELLAGKPSTLILETAAARLGLAPERCLVTGDRLETDIVMGKRAGMVTAVTLTGVTRREDVQPGEFAPDLVIENLGDLLKLTR